jgi:hypothetical protein
MTTLTRTQCESFWKDGFICLEKVAEHAEINTLRAVGDRLLREKAGFNQGMLFDFYPEGEGPDKPKLAQLHHPSHFERSLLESDLSRRLQRVAAQLLGPKARFVSDSFFHKPAHTSAVTPWHQDEAFTDPNIEHREVNFWFPLQPVSTANGCMQFIPGSHLGPVLLHGPIGGDPSTHGLECSTGFVEADAVICPLEIGDCTIHAGRTLHFAGPNHSDAPRYAYSMVFGLPRRASREVRSFPWNENRRLSRDTRVHSSSGVRGGFWPYVSRKAREFDYTNFYEWRLGAARVARLIKRKRPRRANGL